MAEVVSFALGKLAAVLQEKYRELQAVHGQIERIQRELLLIQALLTDADSERDKKELVTAWLNQVREKANEIATVIDTFRDKIEENHAESSNLFRKIKSKITKDVRRNYTTYMLDLPGKLEGITHDLNRIYQRGIQLGIQDKLGALDDVDDPEVVGFEDDKDKIIEQLLDRKISRCTVLSIVGTGGLGKTTLAKKVYKSEKLKGQFACCTWLPISRKFNSNDLLRKILYSIKPEMKDKNPQVTDNDLPVEIKSSLSFNRYLIVLDDVWSVDLWELLRTALPDTNNASRVIITTRLIDVAKAADCNTEPYKLRYLDDSESLALLFGKAFQQFTQPENYPGDLLDVAKRLTKKCDGLPLALVVLGGSLTRIERNCTDWSTLENTMDWHNEDGMKCSQVLARSYEDLPYHVKPCFLYFAAFPENYVFSGKHVTKMWVAEGFIPEDGFAAMEDRAEAYLEELVQRCLIRVTEKSWNGCCKYGTMHILLRDLAIREAKEKNFFTVFSKAEEYDNQLAARKPRRAALQFCTPSDGGVLENTRSLLYFGENSSNDSGFRLLNYSGFRLLRVLTIEHVDMRNSAGLVGLIHLRYLGFRYCTFRQEIFVKISFYNLETIDLKGSCIEGETTYWSDVIIPNLRHVYGYKKLERIFPLKLDHHTNLQTLKSVGQGQVHSLECCTNLRTLGISYTKDNERPWCPLTEWQTLKGVLKRTEQLVSLSIEVTLGGGCLVPFGSTEDLPCHEKIQSLQLCGKWGIGHQYPSVEMFPTYLTKLTLEESSLQKDPMPIFERLQSLRTLRLGPYSYEGTELICSTGGFPNLEKLELKVLPKLRQWDIKEGAMPILSHLKIDQCDELHALPELQKVQTLQELLLNRPSGELQQRMQGKDRYKIEHIPSVRITTDLGAQPAVSEKNPLLTLGRTETSLHGDGLEVVGLEADKCEIIMQLPSIPTNPSDVDDLEDVDLEADKGEIIKQLPSWPTNPSDKVIDDPEPSDKVDDLEIVGLEADKCNIINRLLDRNISRRMVLSIVGTGGLGKTTLAQKVYKSAKLEGQFDCRAWLSISQKYNLYDLWREILYSVEPQMKTKNPPITDGDLVLKLKSSLRHMRYLIILDDVWDIDLWEHFKIALPDLDNACRVIITTRSLDVAIVADCNTEPCKLHYLSELGPLSGDNYLAEAVASVLEKLAAVLLEKVREVQAVRGQIEQVQKELLWIQALLKDVDPKCNRNNVVTEWLDQVRKIATRIETVIDTFRVKIEENRAKSSNWVARKITKARKNYKKYKLGLHDELEYIIEQIDRLYKCRTDMRIEDLGALDDVDDPEPSDVVDDPEVVGLEDDQEKIIEQLLDSSISRRTVLSIVGTGGLGKTTLAQKVYKSDKLEGQFDCRAWQSISGTYILNDIMRAILYSVKPQMKKKDLPVTDRDLPVKLKSSLIGKRYLIILDDVWDINLWGQLKMALPDVCNASRVIITTRSLDVAKAADCNTKPYKLRYLSDAEGVTLLFRNAFQQHVQPESYPHVLDVAKRLTKKCGGLPLALVVLGGILTRKDHNYTAWNTVDETIDWHDKDGIQCSQVLARSYEDLPRFLKDCFLYFAAFPEDYKISAQHVTRMWMAEGFIPKDGAGTIEDRAEKCLQELVERCLIQVIEKSWNGNCKYCSMHNLLRDLAIRKAKDENFFTVFSKEEEDVNNLVAGKPHRAALQFCTSTEDGIYSENTRSLLCFGFGKYSDNNSGFGLLNYSGFRLLRVLTLQRIDMSTFTRRQWPKGLIHLRYLGLRDCRIPHDIFKKFSFSNLETLDLNGSELDHYEETLDLCDVVIPTLRHVYGEFIFRLPLKWDKHTNLQTIMGVKIQIESVVELGFCIHLRTLVIFIEDKLDNGRAIKEWQNLKGVLRRTEQLAYLSISTDGLLPFGGTKGLPCHGKIQKLVLSGKWERNICVPSVEMFPTNLTKLQLIDSKLQEDPMPILERLQSLRILYLYNYSYVGTALICSTGGFPNLEKLKVVDLPDLDHWDIKEGAMPILRQLLISYCKKLHVLPELQKVWTLQKLTVSGPSRELWEGMQMQGKDVHKIKHIPSVCIRDLEFSLPDEDEDEDEDKDEFEDVDEFEDEDEDEDTT